MTKSSRSKSSDPIRKGPGFYSITAGMLVVGRSVETSLTPAEILGVVDAADALTPHEDFRWIAASDLSRWSGGRKRVPLTWAFGIKVETGIADHGPSSPFAPADVERKAAIAKKVLTAAFWTELGARLGDPASARLSAAPVRPTLAAFGPLASCYLAFGREVASGKDLVRGTTMQQESHETGIQGPRVATAEDWAVVEVDFTKEAHAARAAGFKGGKYHIVARYD
jgi:hypothetical protein